MRCSRCPSSPPPRWHRSTSAPRSAPLSELLPVAALRPVSATATPELVSTPLWEDTPVPDPASPWVVLLCATLPVAFASPEPTAPAPAEAVPASWACATA